MTKNIFLNKFFNLEAKNSSPGPKNQNIWKMKKKKSSQIFTQRAIEQKISQIRPFLNSPSCPKVFERDRQTDRNTDIHSQILAQLKSRKNDFIELNSFGNIEILI